jgi:CRP/FNR family cyclic AMP-dependent transcriptional regulator
MGDRWAERARTIATALRGVALFHELPEANLQELTRQVVRRRVARDEEVFAQGDTGDGLYVVASGLIGIVRQSPEGDELLLALYEPGESFGELALIDGAPRSASAVALEASTLLVLPRAAFRATLDTHPTALWRCLEAVVRQLRRLTDVADDIALVEVRRRLAHTLLRLADRGVVETAGHPPEQGRRPVRLTQQHLANMTGTTRESVNKQLQAFAAEGLIALEQGRVRVVDRAGLETRGDGVL